MSVLENNRLNNFVKTLNEYKEGSQAKAFEDVQKLINLLKGLNSDSIRDKSDAEKLIESILLYIEICMEYCSRQQLIRKQIVYITKCLEPLELTLSYLCSTQKKLKEMFVLEATEKFFDIFLEDNHSFWCKKQLLKTFNNCIHDSPKQVRISVAKKLMYQLYRLVDCLSTTGAYDLQATVVETVFRIYGHLIKENECDSSKLIPGYPNLCDAFKNIDVRNYDESVRNFLRLYNETSDKIFSIMCKFVILGSTGCLPPSGLEHIGGIWVDFDLQNYVVSWFCERPASIKNDSDENCWTLIHLLSSDVTNVKVDRSSTNTQITLSYKYALLSDDHGMKEFLKSVDKNVKLIIAKENQMLTKFINSVLPHMFKGHFEHYSQRVSCRKGVYKPLQLRLTKVARRSFNTSSTGTSDSARKSPCDNASKPSFDRTGISVKSPVADLDTTSASGNEKSLSGTRISKPVSVSLQEPVISSSQNDKQSLTSQEDSLLLSNDIEIISGRCSGNEIDYSKLINRVSREKKESLQFETARNYFSQDSGKDDAEISSKNTVLLKKVTIRVSKLVGDSKNNNIISDKASQNSELENQFLSEKCTLERQESEKLKTGLLSQLKQKSQKELKNKPKGNDALLQQEYKKTDFGGANQNNAFFDTVKTRIPDSQKSEIDLSQKSNKIIASSYNENTSDSKRGRTKWDEITEIIESQAESDLFERATQMVPSPEALIGENALNKSMQFSADTNANNDDEFLISTIDLPVFRNELETIDLTLEEETDKSIQTKYVEYATELHDSPLADKLQSQSQTKSKDSERVSPVREITPSGKTKSSSNEGGVLPQEAEIFTEDQVELKEIVSQKIVTKQSDHIEQEDQMVDKLSADSERKSKDKNDEIVAPQVIALSEETQELLDERGVLSQKTDTIMLANERSQADIAEKVAKEDKAAPSDMVALQKPPGDIPSEADAQNDEIIEESDDDNPIVNSQIRRLSEKYLGPHSQPLDINTSGMKLAEKEKSQPKEECDLQTEYNNKKASENKITSVFSQETDIMEENLVKTPNPIIFKDGPNKTEAIIKENISLQKEKVKETVYSQRDSYSERELRTEPETSKINKNIDNLQDNTKLKETKKETSEYIETLEDGQADAKAAQRKKTGRKKTLVQQKKKNAKTGIKGLGIDAKRNRLFTQETDTDKELESENVMLDQDNMDSSKKSPGFIKDKPSTPKTLKVMLEAMSPVEVKKHLQPQTSSAQTTSSSESSENYPDPSQNKSLVPDKYAERLQKYKHGVLGTPRESRPSKDVVNKSLFDDLFDHYVKDKQDQVDKSEKYDNQKLQIELTQKIDVPTEISKDADKTETMNQNSPHTQKSVDIIQEITKELEKDADVSTKLGRKGTEEALNSVQDIIIDLQGSQQYPKDNLTKSHEVNNGDIVVTITEENFEENLNKENEINTKVRHGFTSNKPNQAASVTFAGSNLEDADTDATKKINQTFSTSTSYRNKRKLFDYKDLSYLDQIDTTLIPIQEVNNKEGSTTIDDTKSDKKSVRSQFVKTKKERRKSEKSTTTKRSKKSKIQEPNKIKRGPAIPSNIGLSSSVRSKRHHQNDVLESTVQSVKNYGEIMLFLEECCSKLANNTWNAPSNVYETSKSRKTKQLKQKNSRQRRSSLDIVSRVEPDDMDVSSVESMKLTTPRRSKRKAPETKSTPVISTESSPLPDLAIENVNARQSPESLEIRKKGDTTAPETSTAKSSENVNIISCVVIKPNENDSQEPNYELETHQIQEAIEETDEGSEYVPPEKKKKIETIEEPHVEDPAVDFSSKVIERTISQEEITNWVNSGSPQYIKKKKSLAIRCVENVITSFLNDPDVHEDDKKAMQRALTELLGPV